MLKAKDLRDQTIDELNATYEDICKEMFKLKNEARLTKKTEKPHLIRQKKKDVARLLTVMNEKRQANKPKVA
jgi:large subunit ribosomal protein L29